MQKSRFERSIKHSVTTYGGKNTTYKSFYFKSSWRYFNKAEKHWALKYLLFVENDKPVMGIALMGFLTNSNKTSVSKKKNWNQNRANISDCHYINRIFLVPNYVK